MIPGPVGSGNSAAYSPDGSRIVTPPGDKTARIWDTRRGAQLAVLSGHADYVESAAYSPDGSRIVTASYDKTTRIWDARIGIPARGALRPWRSYLLSCLLARRQPHRHRVRRQDRPDLGRTHGIPDRIALRPCRPRGIRRLLARRHAHRHRIQ